MFRLTQPLQTMILRSTPLLLRGVPLRRAATKTVLASVAPSLVAKKRQQSTQQTKRSTISSARVPAVTEKKTKKFVRKFVQKLKTAAKPKTATKKTVTKIVTKSATKSARKIVRKPKTAAGVVAEVELADLTPAEQTQEDTPPAETEAEQEVLEVVIAEVKPDPVPLTLENTAPAETEILQEVHDKVITDATSKLAPASSVAPSLVAKKRQQSTQQTERSTISSARVSAVTEKFLRAISTDIWNAIGPGFTESIYHAAFEVALRNMRLQYETECVVPVFFSGQNVGHCRVDLIVDGTTVVELKAGGKLNETHRLQMNNYLNLLDLQVGYLINFPDKNGTYEFELILREKPPAAEDSHI